MKFNSDTELFVTSDTHFGHKKILEYQPNRDFCTLEGHNQYLINKWNTTVPETATIFHLGDFIFYEKDFNIISRLNGNIILIKGNHDHNTKKLNIPVYEYLKVNYGGINIVLMHYPLHDWEQCNHGSLHFHGHTHGRLKKNRLNRFDVGVDTNAELRPYNFNELVNLRTIGSGLRRFAYE